MEFAIPPQNREIDPFSFTIQIRLATFQTPTHPGQMMRAPFLNNIIPLSRQNIVATNLFSNTSLYPLPINDQLQNNQLNTQSDRVVGDQFDVKIDANLTSADKIFGRYSNSRQDHPLVKLVPTFIWQFLI